MVMGLFLYVPIGGFKTGIFNISPAHGFYFGEFWKEGIFMENKKKAIVVSITGRLVKRTASRHYWLYDGTKWVRLGLTRIADELEVSTDVIKASIYVEAKKASTMTTTEKATKGFKYWFYNIADSADIAFLIFFIILGVALMGIAYATNDTTLIALCGGFDALMALCVGLLTVDGYRSAVKFSEGRLLK